MFNKSLIVSALVAVLAQVVACSDSDSGSKSEASGLAGAYAKDADAAEAMVLKVLETNADIAHAAYSDAVETAQKLKDALRKFEDNPTAENLVAAKKAWLVAREPYGQTEVYRFRSSPIDSTRYPDAVNEDGPESRINAWPLGEGLIDYVITGTDFGDDQLNVTAHRTGVEAPIVPTGNNIINTSSIDINGVLLHKTVAAKDGRDVIAGYHAIEFLLWGQDLNIDGSADTLTSRETGNIGSDGLLPTGGHRPLSDFDTSVSDSEEKEKAKRRHKYLEVAVAKLVSDLEDVRDDWKKGATYRTAFVKADDHAEALQKLSEILTGMGTLAEGELAGERMQVAFSSNSQEDEHSCFSDNTHRDIWLNAEGIANSYFGEYNGYDSNQDGTDDAGTKVNGYGLDDLLNDLDQPGLSKKLKSALAVTEANYKAIDAEAREGRPFDVLIHPDNKKSGSPVYKTILALNAESAVITEVAAAIGITGDVVDPEASTCDTSKPNVECPTE